MAVWVRKTAVVVPTSSPPATAWLIPACCPPPYSHRIGTGLRPRPPKLVGSVECGFVVESDAAAAVFTLLCSWGIYLGHLPDRGGTLQKQVSAMYRLALPVDGYGPPDQQAVAAAGIARHSVMSRRLSGLIWMRVLVVPVAVVAFP